MLKILLIFFWATSYAQYQSWEFNPTVVLSLSLARSGDLIPSADMPEVINSLKLAGKVPRRYQDTFARMLRLSQMLLEIKSSPYYFPVGYEFESAHGRKESDDQFESGARALSKTVNQTFGVVGKPKLGKVVKEGNSKKVLSFLDDAGQNWSVVSEYVRDDISTAMTGWETITPPFFNPDYLRNIASFVMQMGKNSYGRSAELTGGHQTFQAYPLGRSYDQNLHGLIVANYLLLKQQYIAAIFDLLEVERYGGAKNFFIRPIVMDHSEMLQEISTKNPSDITIEYLSDLMSKKYGVKEFDAHIKNAGNYSEKEKTKMLKKSDSQKLAFFKLWKYHDTRIKYLENNLVLIEDRLGEYRSGDAEYTIKVTFFNELLLRAATKLASKGDLFSLNLLPRGSEESDDSYWLRMVENPSFSVDRLMDDLGLDLTERNLLLEKKFQTRRPNFRVLDKPSWGFEMEFVGHQFVDIVVPKDLFARSKWRQMTNKEKVAYFGSLIANESARESWFKFGFLPYNEDARRIVTVEFEADTMLFPFLDPDLYLEDSGNFEIKSNGRFEFEFAELKKKISQVSESIKGYGMHVHLFIPESYLQSFRKDSVLAKKASELLERVSLYMAVDGYHDVKPKKNYHALDSWSLDRYSQKDISMVTDWLKGIVTLDNLAQKYHNIGFRVVDGGLDLEGRDLGSNIELAELVMKTVYEGFIEKKFVDFYQTQQHGLFFDFRDYSPSDTEYLKRFTLVEALSKRRTLSIIEQNILYKLQFEIYKPSMKNFMSFGVDDDAWNSVPSQDLDPSRARTNFESNVVMPIWNFEEQSYLGQSNLVNLLKARETYLDKVSKLVRKIGSRPKFDFILKESNFLYLAKWMKRSTHPDKPNLSKVDRATAEIQSQILEELVYELRSYVVEFVQAANLKELVFNTLRQNSENKTLFLPNSLMKSIKCESILN